MLFYILLLTIAVVNCFFPVKIQKITTPILFCVLMLLCGLRGHDVGRDTVNYVFFAENPGAFNLAWGPIYSFFISVSQSTSDPATTFLFIMAVFTYIPLMIISRTVSSFPALTVLMYMIPNGLFFYESFNLARQILAISYILVAVVYLSQNKIIISLLFAILGFFLHPYTIFFVPFYFVNNIRFSQGSVYILIIFSAFLGVFGVLDYITDVLGIMTSTFEDSSFAMFTKFAKYGEVGSEIESHYSMIGALSHILPLSLICILGAKNASREDVYYKMMVIGAVVTNLFVGIIYCERIASTFTIAQILAIPLMFKTAKPTDRIKYISVVALTAMLYIYNLYQQSQDINVWTPYHTIFSK